MFTPASNLVSDIMPKASERKRVTPRTKDDLKIPKRRLTSKSGKSKSRAIWYQIGGVVVVAIAAKYVMDAVGIGGMGSANNNGSGNSSSFSKSTSAASPINPAVAKFLSKFVCQHDKGYCHSSLEPTRRTHKAKHFIPEGTAVLKVPRELQIWDLDAFRDDFVKEELLGTRHGVTNNPIDGGAFLAAYLLRRFVLHPSKKDPLKDYYNILPVYSELKETFPTLWEPDAVAKLIEPHSSSFSVIRAYKDMMESEYRSFSQASETFGEQVSETEYYRMRVLVLSRSFGTGPPTTTEGENIEEEIEHYRETTGVDFSKGCRAMVPVLDMYNHHAVPNVEWKYDHETQEVVVKAAPNGIQAGYEVYDSYGTFTDSHLFAKFGFVNGDGSGYTQVSTATLHRLLDVGLKQQFSYYPEDEEVRGQYIDTQKIILGRYLQFDEGYSYCIEDMTKTPRAYTLKKLKLQHLMRIANQPNRWILNIKPRNRSALPGPTSSKPIMDNAPVFDYSQLDDLSGGKFMHLCRLIALTAEDFDGEAIKVLEEALTTTKDAIKIEPQSDGLEYRSLVCMHRLTALSMHRSGNPDLEEEAKYLERLTRRAFGSPRWHAKHVRLGELQSTNLISELAQAGAHEYAMKITDGNASNIPFLQPIRNQPCPWNFTEALANQTEYV